MTDSARDRTPRRPFRIVTDKRWLAELFAPLGAVQDAGCEIEPGDAHDTIWWAPGAWAARARKAGVHLPLLSCGPRWLDRLPWPYRGRDVVTLALGSMALRHFEPEVFVKLSEAKHDSCQARVYRTTRLEETMQQFHFPPDTLMQVQGVVEFVVEARFWVARGNVVANSLYRIDDLIWGATRFADAADGEYGKQALSTMRALASEVAADVSAPPGYVLDVGLSAAGRPLVIETNPAWSSGPYDAEPAAVYETILAAHDFADEYPQWAWQPNPIFDQAEPLKTVRAQNR